MIGVAMAARLTDKLVKALTPPDSGNRITYDTEIKGFGVRVTASDARAFVVNYRINGRERRYTVGAYPSWSVAAAREEARRLKREIAKGHDPMGQRHVDRAAPTVGDLADRYMREHAVRKVARAQADDRSMIEKIIIPAIGQLKVYEVRRDDIDRLHREVSQTRPIRANRLAQLLSKMFSLANRWEYRLDNPVKGLHRNPEQKRTRYLSGEELQRLTAVLADHPNRQSANVIRLLLLTGARRGELLNATWDQFDLEGGIWIKPSAHTKQKPGEPLREIKSFWSGVCRRAGLEDFRIHDLRHTYASILASAGLSLPVIGALLGHTQPNTTARYSHLFDDPLREATERVSDAVNRLASSNG
jgi:integrase